MAGAKPNEVGWTAFRLALAGFIVPFFFIYSPEMILISDSGLAIFLSAISGLAGVYLLSVAVEGYFMIKLPLLLRGLSLAGAVVLIVPGIMTDVIGVAIALVGWLIIMFLKSRQKPAVAA